MQRFITRNKEGVLVQNSLEWDIFVDNLLSMAKNERELNFIGQLVEDLQYKYDEKQMEIEDED